MRARTPEVFGVSPDPRGRRGQLPDSELPGHRRPAPWLDLPPDLTAEFEADLDDIRRLVETVARRQD